MPPITFDRLPSLLALLTMMGLLVTGIVKGSQIVTAVDANTSETKLVTNAVQVLTTTVRDMGSEQADMKAHLARIDAQQEERAQVHEQLSAGIAANRLAIEDLYARIGVRKAPYKEPKP